MTDPTPAATPARDLAGTLLVLDTVRLPGSSEPTSVTIEDGHIRAVGAVDDRPATRVDLEGRTLVPGLWDTHAHLEQWAATRRRLDLRDTRSAQTAADLAATAAAVIPAAEPVIGVNFRGALWPDEPHRDLLDAAVPGREVALFGHDLHTGWLSSAALARIGMAAHPTGVLVEQDCYRAMRAMQEFDAPTVDAWVADALSAAAARGITGIIDFEFGDALPAWQRRAGAYRLDTRIVTTVYPDHLEAAIDRGLRTGDLVAGTDGLVEVGPLKLFVDGSLNSRTALCHEPYPALAGTEHAHGRLETAPEELHELLRRAAAHGLDSAVHAIGDRAVAVALDAFEATGCRGRIEHAQLIGAADVARFARPGLTVGVQPAHLLDDRDVAEHHWPGRTHRAFPLAELLAAGAHVEFGSDAPVAALDPWLAIAAAVSRTADDRGPWHPEQRIGVADALAASSRGRTGLRAGDPADLVVLDRDPLGLDATELTDPGVAGTLCAGRWTHRTF